MGAELTRLTKKDPAYGRMRRLYKTAFPFSERAPFFLLAKKAEKGKADWWAICDGEKRVGFFYVIDGGDARGEKDLPVYVFYFAVEDAERGKGYGGEALTALKEKYKDRRLFLAVEEEDEKADNNEQRIRRKRFYRRNGFESLNLRLREGPMIYELLGAGGDVSAEEYRRLIDGWLGSFWRRLVGMEIIS